MKFKQKVKNFGIIAGVATLVVGVPVTYIVLRNSEVQKKENTAQASNNNPKATDNSAGEQTKVSFLELANGVDRKVVYDQNSNMSMCHNFLGQEGYQLDQPKIIVDILSKSQLSSTQFNLKNLETQFESVKKFVDTGEGYLTITPNKVRIDGDTSSNPSQLFQKGCLPQPLRVQLSSSKEHNLDGLDKARAVSLYTEQQEFPGELEVQILGYRDDVLVKISEYVKLSSIDFPECGGSIENIYPKATEEKKVEIQDCYLKEFTQNSQVQSLFETKLDSIMKEYSFTPKV